VTLDQFRYFLAAARFQHVAKAAQSVAISPSAVSAAIAALEAEFGCALFRREGRAIVLNDQGRYLRDELDRLFDHLSVIRRDLQGAAGAIQGSYRIGASHFLAPRYLARAWTSLQREHEKLEGELCSMSTHLAMAGVLDGTLDLALAFSPLRHPELQSFTLYEGTLLPTVRKNHPLVRRPGKPSIKSLSDYPATLHKSAPGVDVCEVHPMFERFGVATRIRCLFDSDDQAVESLLHTDSWSLLPDLVVQTYRTSLRALPVPKGWDAPYSVAAVVRPHRTENQTILLLIARLRSLFESPAK
jgi:DNA-binding transcriptional LysR family regulator